MRFKYLILLIIVAAASYYIYQDKKLRSKLMGKVHQVAPELNQSTLYKWQNKPPGKGITFTTITSQDQINVMPSPSSKEKK